MDFDVTRFAAARPADFTPQALPLQHLERPQGDDVHVWHLDLGLLSASLQAALDSHSVAEHRLRLTRGQLRFARRFYLRLLLGAYLGVPGKAVSLVRNPRGKPVLDASKHDVTLHFSMAKSGDRLLLGCSSTHHVGVDLEPRRRRAHNARGVAARYFSETESDALARMAPAGLHAAFLRTWACKEAVVKASGLGIANQLCRFTVETDLAAPPAVLDFDGDTAARWSLVLLHPEQEFLGALALPGPIDNLVARRLAPMERAA
ncbi:MAG: 4'-phosphopantetheinyl transferase superfamily protein [Xanthomonadales bacterium]